MGPKVNKDVFCDLVELCAAIINKKPWTRARKVCRVLEYGKPTKAADTVKHLCSKENYAHKWQLNEFVSETNFMDRPKESRKDDYYINEEGMYEIVFSSQQPKAKDFRRHCCNVLFPHVQQYLANKMKEDHQQAIEEKDNQIQQKILRLNEEIDDLIKNKHVARRGYFDNVLCFIKKNSKEAHPYYVIRCQYRQLEKYKKCLKLRYPNMEEAGRCDDPNAIHRWNIFKREVIEKPNCYKSHFGQMEKKRELLETVL